MGFDVTVLWLNDVCYCNTIVYFMRHTKMSRCISKTKSQRWKKILKSITRRVDEDFAFESSVSRAFIHYTNILYTLKSGLTWMGFRLFFLYHFMKILHCNSSRFGKIHPKSEIEMNGALPFYLMRRYLLILLGHPRRKHSTSILGAPRAFEMEEREHFIYYYNINATK